MGHLIPAGTGVRKWHNMVVGSQDEFDKLTEANAEEAEVVE